MLLCHREDGLWKITQLHNQGVGGVYTRTSKIALAGIIVVDPSLQTSGKVFSAAYCLFL